MNKRLAGTNAENAAIQYLQNKGYKLVGKNFYASNYSEIDLIMRDKEFIVFVEVKSIKENTEYYIYETLTGAKKRKIKRGIDSWLIKNNKINSVWRFDFVGIIYKDNVEVVEHFKFVEL